MVNLVATNDFVILFFEYDKKVDRLKFIYTFIGSSLVFYMMTMPASKLKRFLAFFIDCLIISFIATVVLKIMKTPRDPFIIALVNYSIVIIYFILQESSKKQATVGKMLFGLYVVKFDGEKISLLKSLFRTLAYSIPILPYMIFTCYLEMYSIEAIEKSLSTFVINTGFEVILVVLICLVLKFIWVLPIFFTKQVRCMHDIITSTFVITNRTV